MNVGKLRLELDKPSNNDVLQIVQDIIPVINGKQADHAAGALVATVVLLGKQTGAFDKADVFAAVEAAWGAVELESECAPSA